MTATRGRGGAAPAPPSAASGSAAHHSTTYLDGASGLSRQSTELELPHSNGGGGAGARAHQPLHDEVSLPGTDDGEPTASVERI